VDKKAKFGQKVPKWQKNAKNNTFCKKDMKNLPKIHENDQKLSKSAKMMPILFHHKETL
jgi:hypothetical protein